MPDNIEHAIIDGWAKIRRSNDARKIAQSINCSTQTIYNVFRQKKYSDKVFEAMKAFYDARLQELTNTYHKILSHESGRIADQSEPNE